MNTNDLPPAAKLAALIEAGVAANPDLTQRIGSLFLHDKQTCALGFAILGAGIEREYITFHAALERGNWDRAESAMGVRFHDKLANEVATKNDAGMSLKGIVESLREGELARL